MKRLIGMWAAVAALSLPAHGAAGGPIEALAPRAAGLALVEVLEVKEVDARPADGNLFLDVRLRILRATGATDERIHIVKALGGMRPPGAPELPPNGPVRPGTFRQGARYWVAFASPYDHERYPQGVVNCWPERDAPPPLEEALRADRFAHRPQYDPRSGLTHSWRPEPDGKNWRVRMERDGKLLWEVRLPGAKFASEGPCAGDWILTRRDQWPAGLGPADARYSEWFLFAETAARLEPANPYGLPAEPHRLTA